jgi:hypothetical protein
MTIRLTVIEMVENDHRTLADIVAPMVSSTITAGAGAWY